MSASAQVPAWKRLGLKLKQPAAGSEPANGGPTVGHPSSSSKRKPDAPPTTANSFHDAKRPRQDGYTAASRNGPGQLRKQKSVTFADGSTSNSAATNTKAPPRSTPQKKSKGPAKKQTPATTDLKPALEYLRQWKSARDTWKFNKNHQSSLIKHVFDANGIPAADIATFYEYIRDLKGFIRMRLRETALEVRTEDQSKGVKAFPAGTKDLDATQARYESILSRFIESQKVGEKRKSFDEPEYVASSEDGDVVIQRLVKRMRAELVLDELSESGDTDTSTTSSSATVTTTNDQPDITTESAEKRVKLNDGTGKRKRKRRTNVDDSSSSESESESDSDTSSSGSSSSDDSDSEDEDDDDAQKRDEQDTSSSSSSSSDEDGDSDDTSSSDEE